MGAPPHQHPGESHEISITMKIQARIIKVTMARLGVILSHDLPDPCFDCSALVRCAACLSYYRRLAGCQIFYKIFKNGKPLMAGVAMRVKENIHISSCPIESVKAISGQGGQSVLLGGRDRRACIVNLSQDLTNRESKVMKAYEGHIKRVTDVEYSPAGDKIITVSADNRMIIWDRETKKNLVVKGHNRNITSVALNNENNKIVTASEDGSFILWNVIGKQISVFGKGMENSHKGWINACGFIPNAIDQLVTASEDGTVKIWDLTENCLIKTFMAGNYVDYEKAKETKVPVKDYDVDCAVKAISFSKDGSLLAYGGRNARVYLVNLATNETLQTIEVPDKVTALASGENQPYIAIAIPNKILLWHIIDSRIVGQYEFATSGEHYCRSLIFIADEVVAGLDNGMLARIEISRN